MQNSLTKGIIIVLALLASIVILVFAVQTAKNLLTKAKEDIEPFNVRTESVSSNSTVILWETKKETQGMVEYGTNPSEFPLFAIETAETKTHSVNLSLLTPNTTYYYRIKIGEKVFDNSGLPWSFTTRVLTQPTPTPMACDLSTFQAKFGTSDPTYDLNKDGVVNSTDYLLCLNQQQ